MPDDLEGSMSVDWHQQRGFKSPRGRMGHFNDVPLQNNAINLINRLQKPSSELGGKEGEEHYFEEATPKERDGLVRAERGGGRVAGTWGGGVLGGWR